MHFEGRELPFRAGDTVASALLVAGIDFSRTTPLSGAARAPYCLMGICYECLVNINGADNQRACQVQAEHGMVVSRQTGARADAMMTVPFIATRSTL
ncbi:(2Fe-2S)-binding protein [Sodalis sp. RH21]